MVVAIANTEAVPKALSSDAGYCSARAVEALCAFGVDSFIAPEMTRRGRRPAPRSRILNGLFSRV